MKRPCLIFFCLLLLVSCRNGSSKDNSGSEKDPITEIKEMNDVPQELETKPILALTSNALQIVDSTTGSSNELSFGMPEGQMVEILTGVIGEAPNSIQINEECGGDL